MTDSTVVWTSNPVRVVWERDPFTRTIEPVRTGEPVPCDLFGDSTLDPCAPVAAAKVCGSRCKCKVNVCPDCSDFMDGRFKCPFTGEM